MVRKLMAAMTRGRLGQLASSNYVRNIVVMASGTAVGQIVVVLGTPIVTRLFTPTEFGVYANYAAVFAVLTIAANLRYELAVSLPESDAEASDIVALCLTLVGVVGAVVTIASLTIGPPIAERFGIPEIAPYLWILGPAVVVSGIYGSLTGWAIRARQFKTLARTRAQQGLGMVTTHLTTGAAGLSSGGLIAGGVVGQSAGILALARRSRQSGLTLTGLGSFDRLRAVFSRYRRFPMLSGSAALLQTAARGLPILLVTGYYGTAIGGFVGLALQILALPVSLLGTALQNVFFGEAGVLYRERQFDDVYRLLKRTVTAQLVLGAAMVGGAALIAPFIIPIVFGQEWAEVAVYVQLLAVMILAQFVASPVTAMFDLAERQDLELLTEVVKVTFLAAPIIAVAEAGGSSQQAIGAAGIGGAFAYVVVLAGVFRVSGRPVSS